MQREEWIKDLSRSWFLLLYNQQEEKWSHNLWKIESLHFFAAMFYGFLERESTDFTHISRCPIFNCLWFIYAVSVFFQRYSLVLNFSFIICLPEFFNRCMAAKKNIENLEMIFTSCLFIFAASLNLLLWNV